MSASSEFRPSDIVSVALQQLGEGSAFSLSPAGSASPEAMAGAFVSWVYHEAGYQLPALERQGSSGFASSRVGLEESIERGWSVPDLDVSPGDLLFFDHDGCGEGGDVGVVVESSGYPLRIDVVRADTSSGEVVRDAVSAGAVILVARPGFDRERPCNAPCWECNSCPA